MTIAVIVIGAGVLVALLLAYYTGFYFGGQMERWYPRRRRELGTLILRTASGLEMTVELEDWRIAALEEKAERDRATLSEIVQTALERGLEELLVDAEARRRRS